jgi:outer membrane protein TolC
MRATLWRTAARFGACIAVAATTAVAQPDANAPLTLEQAVALALRNDPRVRNAGLQVERAQKSLAAARTQRLPMFDVEAQASRLVTPVSVTFPRGAFGQIDPGGPVPANDTRVESSTGGIVTFTGKVVQPLSQLYRIGLGVRASEIGRDLERQRLRQLELDVVNEVRRVYYGILANERALESALQQLDVENEVGRLVAAQLEREVVLRSAAMDADTRRAAQAYTIQRLRDEIATGKERLNMLIGHDVDRDFAIAGVSESVPATPDWDEVRERALAQRPDLAQARLQKDLAETSRRSKKSEFLPDLSLALSYQSFFNVDLLPRDITQVGLVLDWEPFDWGRKHRELGEQSRAVLQAQNSIEAARDAALIEVRDRWRKVEQARSLLDVRAMALAAAHEKTRVVVNRRAEEASLVADALRAQAESAEASAQYQQALLSLWTARADLEEVVGEAP